VHARDNGRGVTAGKLHGVLVAAVASLAVLAMLWSVGVAELPDPPPPGRADEAEPSPVAVVAATDTDEAVAVPGARHSERDDVSGAALPAILPIRLLVKRRLGGASSHYLGPVSILVDGRVVVEHETVNNEPIAFELPRTTKQLTVVAPHHHPQVHKLGSPEPDCWMKEKVQLEPMSRLRVTLKGLPVDWRGRVKMHLHTVSGEDGSIRLEPLDGAWVGEGPCVHGERLQWCVQVYGKYERGSLLGWVEPLQPGESRAMVVGESELTRQQYRIVGPSSELLPYLGVTYNGRPYDPVKVGPDGRFVLWACDVEELSIFAGSKAVALEASDVGNEILLRPAQRLVGLGMVDAKGDRVDFYVTNKVGAIGFGERSFVFTEREFPDPLILGRHRKRSTEYEPPSLGVRDVVVVKEQEPPPWYVVEVVMTGEKPGEAELKDVKLGLLREGHVAGPKPIAERMTFKPLGDGEIKLQWSCGRTVREETAEVVTGDPDRIMARWPHFERWTGEVLDMQSMPDLLFTSQVLFHGDRTVAALSFDVDGKISGAANVAPAATDRVTFRTRRGREIPAEILSFDKSRRYVEVRVAGVTREVVLEVDEASRWHAFLYQSNRKAPTPASMFRAVTFSVSNRWHSPLRIHESERLAGVLFAGVNALGNPHGARPVAWFSVDASSQKVVVRNVGGHDCELVVRRPIRGAWLVGPEGQVGTFDHGTLHEPKQVFMPLGTTALKVWLADGTEREYPVGTASRIVIE